MRKEILISIGIGIILLFALGFMLFSKPGNSEFAVSHAAKSEQPVMVSEFTSKNVIIASQYELGEIPIELKNQKNCIFKTTLSLGYEKNKEEEALKVLQPNETKVRQYIESFFSEQSPEKLKNFSTDQSLEIDLVNGINKQLKQFVVLVIYRKNSVLDCK